MPTRDFQYDIGGLTTLVCVLYLDGGTTMVNASTGAAIAATSANLNTAAIACSDSARAGQYRYTIPAAAAGTYNEVFYLKSTNGTTLVQADTVTPYGAIGIGQFNWNGTAVVDTRTGTVDTVSSIGTGGITSGSFANNSITAAATANDYVAEVQNGLATATGLTTIQNQTDKIGTNAADSPNAVTAQESIDENLPVTVGGGGGGDTIEVEMNTIEGE